MKTDVELNSENASPAGETAGQGQTSEPSVATPPEPKAAAPLDAASGENPAKAGHAQAVAPSVESDMISPPGDSSRGNVVAASPVALAPLDWAEIDPLGDALSALDRKDYATAQRLFEALGRTDAAKAITDALAALDRRDYAAAQGLFDALNVKGSAAARAKQATLAPGPAASGWRDRASQKPGVPRIDDFGAEDAAYRRPPRAEKTRARGGRKTILLGTALALLAILGASAMRGAPSTFTFAGMESQTIAGLASAVDAVKAPLAAITGESRRDEERAAIADLRAALTQVTTRLDQIEQEHGARLDKLSAHIDQDSSSATSNLAARLDGLEKKAVAPARPAPNWPISPRGSIDWRKKLGLRPPPNWPRSRRGSTSSRRWPPPWPQHRPGPSRPPVRNHRRFWPERSLPTIRSLCCATLASRMSRTAWRLSAAAMARGRSGLEIFSPERAASCELNDGAATGLS
jgi:hypothetical protein